MENPEIFIKLDFEFAKDYPKVPLKVSVVDVQPKNPKLSKELSAIITTIPRSNLGSECVHEVTGRVDELLNSTAVSRAAKENPFSLEEERAHREAAARSAAQQQEHLLKKKQQDEAFQSEQALALRLESERKRREQPAVTVPDEMAPDFEVADSSHQVKFDQAMVVQDTLTGKDMSFKTVDGRLIITRRDDKLMVVVTPGITDKSQNPPQLLLKRIFLPQRLGSKEELQRKMGQIEELLAKSKKQRHENIVDLFGYRIIEPASEITDWELDIVSDWAREGSLENLLQLSGTLTAARVKDWTLQLIEGLIFLESAGFVHPAIHASNVLIFRSRSGAVTVKLSDGYGTALRNLVDEARPPNSPEASIGRPWKAPELNPDKSNRTTRTCIWDLGNVVLHMALGQDVFEHFATPHDCLSRKPFTLHFRDLLVKLFEKHPRERPQAFKVKSYAFFFDKPPVLFHQSEFASGSRGPKGSHEVSELRWESNWDIIEQLGKGGQGKVVKARNVNDQGIYAVKMIPAKNSDVLTVVRQEVLLLKDLKHPSIVRYYSAWTEQNPEETTTSTSYSSSYDGDPINLRGSRHAPTTQRPPMTIVENDDFMISHLPTREFESADRLLGGGGISFAKPSAGASDDNSADYANAWDRVAEAPEEKQALHQGGISFENSRPSVHQVDDSSSEGGRDEDDQNDPEQEERDRRAVAEIDDRKRKSTLYIQMEYCDQKTLRQMIKNYDLPSKPDEMWRVFRSILDGLKYIHEQGITHRDLKPDNIFLDSYNNPKIGDFGLATAAFAAHSGNVGTPFYIAPELLHLLRSKDRDAGKLGSKVDMYSLGIMFFEMNFPLPTNAEKFQVLDGLNQAHHKLPQRFSEPGYEVQGRIILELIEHNPKTRPEAADLLDRPEIPEPIEDEKLRRRLFWMMEKEPDTMLAWLKVRPNDDVLDLSWDYKGKDEKLLDPVTVDFVISELRNLFHRHGAVSTARQGPFPKAVQYNNPVTYLGHDGLVLQLPQDLTLPFARTVAHQYPEYSKCYSIDSVFRPRPDRSQGDEPFRILEVDFDVVSPETTDLSLKDATAICVLDDIVRTFPALDTSSWNILLSHNDLIDIILQSCRIATADFTRVKKQLATLYSKGVAVERIREQWETIRATLRSKAFNIRETSVAALSKFVHIVGSVVEVQAQLSKLLEKDVLVADAVAYLARLQEILKYLERFRLQTSVSVAPLSNNGESLYPGSVMFQCVHRKSGTLAAGGRYDNLIRYHQRGMQAPVIARAVGFRLNLGLIVSRLASAGNASSKLLKTTSRDHSAAAASLAAAPSRVDVLVTSFDAASRTSAGLDCLSLLLAGGIATELTEEVETMEGIEELYARDTPYWLVIVKGMALAEDGKVKVRTPGREEVEVAVKELVSWLGREMGRKGKVRK